MPCPVASALTVSAIFGGFYTLLVQDVKLRLVSRLALAILICGWAAYFALLRTGELRILLDASSTLAVIAGGARVYWLVRFRKVVPPLYSATTRLLHSLAPMLKSPTVLALKIWLLCMIVSDLRSISHFSAMEYWIVSILLVAAIVYKLMHVRYAKRQIGYPDLEKFAAHAPPPRCPLGFGCDIASTPAQQNSQKEHASHE